MENRARFPSASRTTASSTSAASSLPTLITGEGIPDHGAIPGRTVEEAVEFARRLTLEDFTRRYHRARADKRRYTSLRRAIDEMLMKIKYMNRVSINMQNGLLDKEGAKQEIELIQKQLHEMIDRMPGHAGMEG